MNTVELEKQTLDGSAPTAFTRGMRVLRSTNTPYTAAFLLVLLIIFSVLKPNAFPTAFNLSNIALDAAGLLLLAVGATFVIITGGIDLSVGSVLVFSGVVSANTMIAMEGQAPVGMPLTLIVGLLVALLSGAAWGFVNGVLIAKANLPALIVTLGTLGAALGLSQIITSGVDLRIVPENLVDIVGNGRILGVSNLVWIAVLVTVLGAIALNLTRFGRHTLAIGSNSEAARRSGIQVDAHLIKVYMLQGTLAGLAGYLFLARFSNTSISGHSSDNLQVIAAVVLGGTSLFGGAGSVLATAIAVFIPAVLQNGFVILGLQPYWQGVAVGVVLVVAVYVDQRRRKSRLKR